MTNPYVPPKILHRWCKDVPGGELYELFVFDNATVCSAYGRFAHSSGSLSCSWPDFIAGQIDTVVEKTVGASALNEAKQFIQGALGSHGLGA